MQGSFSFHIFPVKSQVGAFSEMCLLSFLNLCRLPSWSPRYSFVQGRNCFGKSFLNAAGSKSFSILSPTHTKKEKKIKIQAEFTFVPINRRSIDFFFPCIKILRIWVVVVFVLCNISGWYWSPCSCFRWSTNSVYKWMFYVWSILEPQLWRVLWFSRTVELLLEICLGFSKAPGNLFLTVNLPFPHC